MTTNGREEICAWIDEQLKAVEEDGALSALLLVHHEGQGSLREVQALKSGGAKWGDASVMADVFDAVATRHARGLIGEQQFELQATYGGGGRVKRTLPFGKAGRLMFGSIPGGLSTEPPTMVGQSQQGMRLAELVVQGFLAKWNGITDTQAALIDRVFRRLGDLERENRELFVVLRQELIRTVQLAHEQRMKELEFARSTEERRKLIKIMPAFVNAVTGSEIFPQSTEDTALVETLADNVTPDQLKMFTAVLKDRSPEMAALLTNRFNEVQKKRAAEAEEIRRMTKEATGGYDKGLAEAGGGEVDTVAKRLAAALEPPETVRRMLGEGAKPADPKTVEAVRAAQAETAAAASAAASTPAATNGASSGVAEASEEPSKVVIVETPTAAATEDTKLLDDLIASVPEQHREVLIATLGSQDASLAQRLKARFAQKPA